MEVKVLKDEKENLIVELDNQTVAELLRVYLNKEDAVTLAAWKREHPDKPVILEIRTKGTLAKGKITAQELMLSYKGKTLNDLIDAMKSGNTYINVHTTKYPDGEIRGQISMK